MTSIFTDYKIRKLQIGDYDKGYLNLNISNESINHNTTANHCNQHGAANKT